jgi:beta-ribofuranosylaminobenzene 5'-phosphate synthase
VPPILFRADIPSNWRFVIGQPVIPSARSGVQEDNAFRKLEPPPNPVIAKAAHIVLMQMMPSIMEADIARFGESMTRLDSIFGDYWEEIQGGRYSHKVIEKGVGHLLEAGAFGVGQSSWGPVFFGLTDEDKADGLEASLRDFLRELDVEGPVFTSGPNNNGAEIIMESE